MPDSDATVEKSVDPVTGAVTLTYGIPKGIKGDKGDIRRMVFSDDGTGNITIQ